MDNGQQVQALAVIPAAPMARAQLSFTDDEQQMIRDSYANGASESEFKMLMGIAVARNLNPLLRQIWFVKRWDSQKKREVWAVQTSIDGLRTIAQRTGVYAGQDEPEYERSDGKIVCAKVRVYRKDWTRPAVGVAYWDEYVQKTKEGHVTKMWGEKPHLMLAKCAEALGLRKAFPEDMGNLYVPEEMGPIDVMPQALLSSAEPAQPAPMTEAQERAVDEKIRGYMTEIATVDTIAKLQSIAAKIKSEPKVIVDAVKPICMNRKAQLSAPPPEPSEVIEVEVMQ